MNGAATVGTVFEKARAEGRAALVGYLPAGLPTYHNASRQ
jgi:tryptophan synthase alpha chain